MNINEAIEKIKSLLNSADSLLENIEVNLDDAIKGIEKITTERKPVIVPKFVADWYEKHKTSLDYNLYLCLISLYEEKLEKNDFYYWMQKSNNPIQTIINMHQFGYEVEKEKKYTVRMKNVCHKDLGYNVTHGVYSFYDREHNRSGIVYEFTKSKLEQVGLSGVFDNPMFEVEEAEC